MNKHEFRDLVKHARDRTRDASMQVTQLLDTEQERTALLLSVAIHFIEGAASSLQEGIRQENIRRKVSNDQALTAAMVAIVEAIGVENTVAALKHVLEITKPKAKKEQPK